VEWSQLDLIKMLQKGGHFGLKKTKTNKQKTSENDILPLSTMVL
jgi:hypothetical protein